MGEALELNRAVEVLGSFLRVAPLTGVIAGLERRLDGVSGEEAAAVGREGGVNAELLAAALTVRRDLGRISDLIHAAGIILALPHLLEEGERVRTRPSLAAGNDPSRPYDLETDRRVAEFKLAHWTGGDTIRKHQTFKDLVVLALDDSDRRAELFVLGRQPAAFLRASRTTAASALSRAPRVRERFTRAFGPPDDTTVAAFTATHAAHVHITDLLTILPPSAAALLA